MHRSDISPRSPAASPQPPARSRLVPPGARTLRPPVPPGPGAAPCPGPISSTGRAGPPLRPQRVRRAWCRRRRAAEARDHDVPGAADHARRRCCSTTCSGSRPPRAPPSTSPTTPTAALRGWAAASVVLVGADLADPVAAQRPPRRDQVHVVAHGPVPDGLFRAALAVGARRRRRAPGRGRLAGRAAHRRGRRRSPTRPAPSAWWAGPAAPARPPSRARSR